MLFHRLRAVALAAIGASSALAHAADLSVPGDYPTIQAAIDAATPGSTVVVGPGVYRENLLLQKALTLRSTTGASRTTIDGRAVAPVLVVRGTGDEAINVVGFTITNGFNSFRTPEIEAAYMAGGVYLESVRARLYDNVIKGNVGCIGVAISTLSTSLDLQRNRITDNLQDESCQGADGGGLLLRADGSRPSQISQNVVARNRIAGRGAGLALQGISGATISYNVIADNVAGPDYGGGILLNSSSADIVGNSITGNSAGYGAGLAVFPIDPAPKTRIVGNYIADNVGIDASAAEITSFYEGAVRFADNVVLGRSTGSLVNCSVMPVLIGRSNVLRNAAGPELGGTCISGPQPR